MGSMKADRPRPHLALLGLQYLFYFGVFGIYLPYFNLYCYHIGFSGLQIGIISALRSVVLVVCALIWSVLADRFQRRRSIFIGCSLASAAAWSLYLTTDRFAPMLLITLIYGVFYAPLISFLEAFSMDVLGPRKRRYGTLRAWGSIGFIAVVLVMGQVLIHHPVQIILILILAGSTLQACCSLALPRPASGTPRPVWHGFNALFQPRLWLFLGGAFLMLVSHGAYYGFFSIHLEQSGHAPPFIAMAWALASMAEIVAMLRSEWLFERFSLAQVLVFSFAAATLRWILVWSANAPAAIVATQILHALTYGTFHMASILYIDTLMPPEAKTLGQALNNAVTYGLGLMVGFFLNGYLFEVLGARSLFLVSAGIALAGGALMALAVKEK